MSLCKLYFLVCLAALAGALLDGCHPAAASAAPAAAFEYAGGPCPSCPVTFQNTSRRSVRYRWDFGDHTGSTWAATQFTHTYARPGRYWVTLTAYGPDDAVTTSHLITVGTPTASSSSYALVHL